MYFGNRRPRGFHYTFRFADERRDILDALRRGVPPEALANRQQPAANAPQGGFGHQRRRGPAVIGWLIAAFMLLVAVLCMLVAV